MPAFLTAAIVLVPGTALAQVTETGFLDRTLTLDGTEYAYQVYVPRNYEAAGEWPAVLFLHGADEYGDEGLKQTDVGLGSAIRSNPERWPTLAIFPQVPEDADLIWQDLAGQIAMAALDETVEEFSIDESRVYLTGLSLGGEGTWYLGYTYPERFAALVPICGYVAGMDGFPSFVPDSSADIYADVAERIQEIPIWIFHGDADDVVPVEESRQMMAALESVDANVQYTEFSGIGHNAWDPAYADEALPMWLFEQQQEQQQ
ncbi:carboxylesterase family protein [Leptothoe kymatousa]|nr:prolyl oligopeptidase family serine peptidase [Leptothoe kymatousa]